MTVRARRLDSDSNFRGPVNALALGPGYGPSQPDWPQPGGAVAAAAALLEKRIAGVVREWLLPPGNSNIANYPMKYFSGRKDMKIKLNTRNDEMQK